MFLRLTEVADYVGRSKDIEDGKERIADIYSDIKAMHNDKLHAVEIPYEKFKEVVTKIPATAIVWNFDCFYLSRNKKPLSAAKIFFIYNHTEQEHYFFER